MYNITDGTYSDPGEERRKEALSARPVVEVPVAAADFVGNLQEASVDNGQSLVNEKV